MNDALRAAVFALEASQQLLANSHSATPVVEREAASDRRPLSQRQKIKQELARLLHLLALDSYQNEPFPASRGGPSTTSSPTAKRITIPQSPSTSSLTSAVATTTTTTSTPSDLPFTFERMLAEAAGDLLQELIITHPQHPLSMPLPDRAMNGGLPPRGATTQRQQHRRGGVNVTIRTPPGRNRSSSFTSSQWGRLVTLSRKVERTFQLRHQYLHDLLKMSINASEAAASSTPTNSSFGSFAASFLKPDNNAQQMAAGSFTSSRGGNNSSFSNTSRFSNNINDRFDETPIYPFRRTLVHPLGYDLPDGILSEHVTSLSSATDGQPQPPKKSGRGGSSKRHGPPTPDINEGLLQNPFSRLIQTFYTWDHEVLQCERLCQKTILQATGAVVAPPGDGGLAAQGPLPVIAFPSISAGATVDGSQHLQPPPACFLASQQSTPTPQPACATSTLPRANSSMLFADGGLGGSTSSTAMEMEDVFVEEVRIASQAFDILDRFGEEDTRGVPDDFHDGGRRSVAASRSSACATAGKYFPLSDGSLCIGLQHDEFEASVLDHIFHCALRHRTHPLRKCIIAFVDRELHYILTLVRRSVTVGYAAAGGGGTASLPDSLNALLDEDILHELTGGDGGGGGANEKRSWRMSTEDAKALFHVDRICFVSALSDAYAQQMFGRRSIPITAELPVFHNEDSEPVLYEDWRVLLHSILDRAAAAAYTSSSSQRRARTEDTASSTLSSGSLLSLDNRSTMTAGRAVSLAPPATAANAVQHRLKGMLSRATSSLAARAQSVTKVPKNVFTDDDEPSSSADEPSDEPNPRVPVSYAKPTTSSSFARPSTSSSAVAAHTVSMRVAVGRTFRQLVPKALDGLLQWIILDVVLRVALGKDWYLSHLCAFEGGGGSGGENVRSSATSPSRCSPSPSQQSPPPPPHAFLSKSQEDIVRGVSHEVDNFVSVWLRNVRRYINDDAGTLHAMAHRLPSHGDIITMSSGGGGGVGSPSCCSSAMIPLLGALSSDSDGNAMVGGVSQFPPWLSPTKDVESLIAFLERTFRVLEYAAAATVCGEHCSTSDIGADVLLPLVVAMCSRCLVRHALLVTLQWLDGGLFESPAVLHGKGATSYVLMTFQAALSAACSE